MGHEYEEDQSRVCVACGKQFVFPLGEQKFFQAKGFPPPKRCPACRAEAREKRERLHQASQERQHAQGGANLGDVITTFLGGGE